MSRNRMPWWSLVSRGRLLALLVLAVATGLVFSHDFILGGGSSPGGPGRPGGGQGARGNNPGGNTRVRQDSDPVDIGIGDYVLERQDVSLPGKPGLGLDLRFTYRSRSAMNLHYGYGWDMSWNRRLRRLANGNVLALRGDNTRYEFLRTGPGAYAAPLDALETLVENPNGTFTVFLKHGYREIYDVNGNIERFEDRHGGAIVFTYDPAGLMPVTGSSEYFVNQAQGVVAREFRLSAITDSAGRTMGLTYDASGRLAAVAYAGRTVAYAYDAAGNQVAVTLPATPGAPSGSTTSYGYDAAHNLTTLTDPLGQTVLTNVYGAHDRIVQQTYGTGTTSVAYFDVTSAPAGPGPVAFATITDRNGNIARYDFDSGSRIVRIEEFTDGIPAGEPPSYVTTIAYDASGNRARVHYPRGNAVEFACDARKNVTEVRRKRIGVPAGQSDPSDLVSTFSYEPVFDFMLAATDAGGNTTGYTYDAAGNTTAITYPPIAGQNAQVLLSYDGSGRLLTLADLNGNVTRFTYDPATSDLLQVTRGFGTPVAATTTFVRDAVGDVTSHTDPNGLTTVITNDAQGEVVGLVSPAPFRHQMHIVRDAAGRIVHVDEQSRAGFPGPRPAPGTTNPADGWRSMVIGRDVLGRPTNVRNDAGFTATSAYDANGNRTSATDPEGRTTSFSYDERDLLAGIVDPAGATTQLIHDLNRNLAAMRDANGNVTSYTYDDFDRCIRTTRPDATIQTRAYDPAGNLTSLTNARGQVIGFTYDARDRITTRTTPSETATFTHDAGGRPLSAADADASIAWTYDALDQVLAEVTTFAGGGPAASVGFHYDAGGRLTALDYPDGSAVQYQYDQLGRMARVLGFGGLVSASFEHDPLGRRTAVRRVNGVSSEYRYDAADRIVETRHLGPGGTVLERVLEAYDRSGRRQARSDASGRHGYGYDAAARLATATHPPAFPFPSRTTAYDGAGNFTSVTTAAGTTAFTANALNQYSAAGGVSLSYDADGNLVSDGSNSYSFDSDNRILQAQTPGGTVIYRYDPLGRRVGKTAGGVTTRLLHSGLHELAETDGAGAVLARFVHGPDTDDPVAMVRGGSVLYHHVDSLGSVTALSGATGQIAETYVYDAWGRPAAPSQIGNPFLFAGRAFEIETGNYHNRARDYDPRLGRFLSRDPVTWAPDDARFDAVSGLMERGFARAFTADSGRAPQSTLFSAPASLFATLLSANPRSPATLHPYAYVASDPRNLVDPTGELFNLVTGIVGAVVGGVANATSAVMSGGDFNEAMASFAIGAGTGFVAGALFPVSTIYAVGIGAVTGAVTSVVTQVAIGAQKEGSVSEAASNINWGAVGGAAVGGAIAGGAASAVGTTVIKAGVPVVTYLSDTWIAVAGFGLLTGPFEKIGADLWNPGGTCGR